jgi:hypothetical protein
LLPVVSFCNRYRGFGLGLYFLFSLTPVRGGTYFLCLLSLARRVSR